MTDERRTQIEEIAKEYGFSFASAKEFLEEIESEVDTNEVMAEMWYWYEIFCKIPLQWMVWGGIWEL